MKKNKDYLYVFLLTFLLLFFVLLILNIYPFGDETLIVSDLRDQYLSFINYLKTIIFGHNNLFYSFSGALGCNMLSLSSYYLMSIFNVFTVFVNTKDMYMVMTIIIMIKLSLCSSSFMYFLNNKYGRKKINYVFSLCYGLMSYSVAFYFHVMWLDSIILLPLVILGIENIYHKKTSSLYLITLFLTIISNYYIGYMICLFSLIYFVYYYFLHRMEITSFKIIFKRYIISSLLSGLLACVILVPVFFSLQSGKTVIENTNVIIPTTYNAIQVLSKLVNSAFSVSQIWHGGPSIFAGSIVTLLMILYFSNKNIRKKEKIINLIVCLFFILTFLIRPLNLFFHGFNEPNCFDYRHAFMFTFISLLIAYESYDKLQVVNNKKIVLILALYTIFLGIIYASNYSWFIGLRSLFLIFSLLITSLILVIFKNKNKRFYWIFLFLVVVFDLLVNTANIWKTITVYEESRSNVRLYQDNTLKTTKVLTSLEKYDNSFYRLEKDYLYSQTINDSMLFGYNGISQFSSTSNIKTEKFLECLGFRRLVSRIYYGQGSTRSVDTLLGIKYVLSSQDNFKNYVKVIDDEVNVYESINYLGWGYAINQVDTLSFTDNIFDNINRVYQSITGINDDLYYVSDYVINYYNLIKEDNIYKKKNLEEDSYIAFNIEVISNDNLYMYFPTNLLTTDFKTASLYINDVYYGKYFDKYNYGVIDLGQYQVGDKVCLKLYINNFDNYLLFNRYYIYYEKADVFNIMYDVLKENTLSLNMLSSSSLKGSISLSKANDMLLTLPYEEGFIIKIDGKTIEYNSIYDSLITFKLPEGSHQIEINYLPKGFILGLIISVISFVITVCYLWYEKKHPEKL